MKREKQALLRSLRRDIAFCELECEIRPVSPRCDTWGRGRKPCGIKVSISEDTERLKREFGIEVDRTALLNESKERERARRKRLGLTTPAHWEVRKEMRSR